MTNLVSHNKSNKNAMKKYDAYQGGKEEWDDRLKVFISESVIVQVLKRWVQ